jgi:hypothetical protein
MMYSTCIALVYHTCHDRGVIPETRRKALQALENVSVNLNVNLNRERLLPMLGDPDKQD